MLLNLNILLFFPNYKKTKPVYFICCIFNKCNIVIPFSFHQNHFG